ncbi:MAG TPA: nitrite/sulfite reductase, partial [Aquabacterium sp.]|nr:nitrite/sulfite reductase [Aquabacterium sp.]
RKFKIAVSGAKEDRAAIYWHDIGLQLVKNDAGEIGFKVLVGGGMGRTPVVASEINAFVPWQQILVYIEAIVRVYNRYGRRDNMYKARIKILVKAEGQKFFDQVNAEFNNILTRDVDGAAHIIPQAEFDRVNVGFSYPESVKAYTPTGNGLPADASDADKIQFTKWLERNVKGHKVQGYKNVHLSVKRVGQAPGDVTDAQMDAIADMADQFSCGELRVTHDQNVLLPFVREEELFALWKAAKAVTLASANLGLLSDMIACPGGDFCALANARSIPIANELIERYQDLDELYDIGDIDLHISGCINSCGHHHTGHIGILGVDKDGSEWYQITLGGSDGSDHAPTSVAGKVIGPSFAADEVTDVIEAVIETYKSQRAANEKFVDTVKRIGLDPFKAAANAVRRTTAKDSAKAA